jgi:hypothetical protein
MFNKSTINSILILFLIFGLGSVSVLLTVPRTTPLIPKYNLLYSDFSNEKYTVKDSKLVETECSEMSSSSVIPPAYLPNGDVVKPFVRFCNTEPPSKLYVHDVGTNQSTEVDFATSQSFKLNPNNTTIDGLMFDPNYDQNNFSSQYIPIFGKANNVYPAIVDPKTKTNFRLKLAPNGGKFGSIGAPQDYSSASFVGWIE